MTHAELIQWLQEQKGTGKWERVARQADVTYSTVAKLARGDSVGRVDTHERLVAAVRVVEGSQKEPA